MKSRAMPPCGRPDERAIGNGRRREEEEEEERDKKEGRGSRSRSREARANASETRNDSLPRAAAATVLHLFPTRKEAAQVIERERERERGGAAESAKPRHRLKARKPSEISRGERVRGQKEKKRRRSDERSSHSSALSAEKVQPSPSGTQALRLRCPSLSARFLLFQ